LQQPSKASLTTILQSTQHPSLEPVLKITTNSQSPSSHHHHLHLTTADLQFQLKHHHCHQKPSQSRARAQSPIARPETVNP
jgi:hypothetical protein